MNTTETPATTTTNGHYSSSQVLPTEERKVCVYTEQRGNFAASRFGHVWRLAFSTHDGHDCIGLIIKESDWWHYAESLPSEPNSPPRDDTH